MSELRENRYVVIINQVVQRDSLMKTALATNVGSVVLSSDSSKIRAPGWKGESQVVQSHNKSVLLPGSLTGVFVPLNASFPHSPDGQNTAQRIGV